MGKAEYPKNILKSEAKVGSVKSLNALDIAMECGNVKAVNVVLIGLLASISEIPYEKWIESVREVVPAKALDVNLKAFKAGYERGKCK